MTGIGGDCFALVKPAGSEDVIALNGSGRAPAALSAAEMRAAGHTHMPLFGAPEPITVPGAVDAFCRLSEDHGKLGLDAVLAPSSTMPRRAFPWRRAPPSTGPTTTAT
jgi:gamma-glutamyltranspeptidase/glutathione hydrolase